MPSVVERWYLVGVCRAPFCIEKAREIRDPNLLKDPRLWLRLGVETNLETWKSFPGGVFGLLAAILGQKKTPVIVRRIQAKHAEEADGTQVVFGCNARWSDASDQC